MSKLYLYDARYNLKTETTYEKVAGLFSIKKDVLIELKQRKERIRKDFYLIDDDTSLIDIRKLYSEVKYHNEAWKAIEGSEEEFLISSYGRFKRISKKNPDGRFILPYMAKRVNDKNRNKQFVKVKFKGVYKQYNVARLVAYHFVDIYYEGRAIGSIGKALKYKKYTYDDVVVFHKNRLVYDNYHVNLEWLDRDDLANKTRFRNEKDIIVTDVNTGKVIGNYKSTRDVEKNLPVSKSAVCDALKTNRVVGGVFEFEYED